LRSPAISYAEASRSRVSALCSNASKLRIQWYRTDATLKVMTAISPKFSRTGSPILNVDDAGGDGLPVIFQHGLCGDARQTAEAFPRDPRFRRITIESRGHRASEAGDPAQFSIHTFADDVATFIEAHRLGPIVIGGISMGAAITLHVAVHRPETVRGLILARPAWVTVSAPANQSPNLEVGWLLGALSQKDARDAFEVWRAVLRAPAPRSFKEQP
jgi:pimeloyl-ACP methyl ester carboxylesterase